MMVHVNQRILVNLLQHLLSKYHVEHDVKVSFFVFFEHQSHNLLKYIYVLNLVPLVTTLVGGDLRALQLIYIDLKNQIPIVIIDVSYSYFLNV